jgi:hypothetical protein
VLHDGTKTIMRGAIPGRGRGCGEVIEGCKMLFNSPENVLRRENSPKKTAVETQKTTPQPEPAAPQAEQVPVTTIPPIGEFTPEPEDIASLDLPEYVITENEPVPPIFDTIYGPCQEGEHCQYARELEETNQQEPEPAPQMPVFLQPDNPQMPSSYDADHPFYDAVREQLEELFAIHPSESKLAASIPESRFAHIRYGTKDYYVVGVINEQDKPRYICYGVPATKSSITKRDLSENCEFLATDTASPNNGYYMMFQDAITGETLKRNQ